MMKQTSGAVKVGIFCLLWGLGAHGIGSPVAGGPQSAGEVNADSLYFRARSIAIDDHNYEQAIALCRELLRAYPEYYDARVLMGRAYAREGLYSRAEQQIRFVLQKAPAYPDALSALVDIYRGWDRPEQALHAVNAALGVSPDNGDLWYKKALIEHRMGDDREALYTLEQLRELDPGYRQATPLYLELSRGLRTQKVLVAYRHDRFESADRANEYIPWTENSAPWRLVHVAYSQEARSLAVRGQLQYAYRYGEQALQAELGVYPRLTKSTTGYLNFGYSPDPLFPEVRADAELTQSLGAGFQAALGARYLDFSADQVVLYTGALSKYFAGYRINARGFLSQTETAFSRAWFVQIRRYFGGTDNYITLAGGMGPSPDQPTTREEYHYRQVRHVSISGQNRLAGFTYLRWELRLANEEWERARYRSHATGILGLMYRF